MNRHSITTVAAVHPSPWSFAAWLSRSVVLPAAIVVALVAWALALPQPVPQAPPGAGIVLAVITLGMAVLAHVFRRRLDVRTQTHVALPDPLYTLYLAAFILTGAPTALPLAAITPFVEAAPDLLWRRDRATTGGSRLSVAAAALRESAAATATTFIAGVVYVHMTPVVAHGMGVLRAQVVAAMVAAAVVFVAVLTSRALERTRPGTSFASAFAQTLLTPSMRFQALLLSIGPLLPLADLLDDIEAEFAWILFLIPLGAVYYLALVSVRLEQRTRELQKTIGELGQSRRREAELTGYAALITRAQEDERRRLARELHDDTAQALIALSRGLDALSARQTGPPLSSSDAHFIRELTELATRTLESVRRACQDLRPSVLDDLGLSAALESLAEATSRQGLPCVFEEDGEPDTYAPELEVTVYRIAQEALSNARRHSGAGAAAIHITYAAGSLDLQVSDNGSGFDVANVLRAAESAETSAGSEESRRGLGLLGMRERAALIGARLRVEPVDGGGTRVSLHVPLRAGMESGGPGTGVHGESAASGALR
ncbi:MAG TPA: sensor histidine kinase [Ktedonobacterales bacterium]